MCRLSGVSLEKGEAQEGGTRQTRENGLGTVGLPIDEAVDVFAEGLLKLPCPLHPGTFGEDC